MIGISSKAMHKIVMIDIYNAYTFYLPSCSCYLCYNLKIY
ncbi:hypothetical protein XNC1_1599 [Xenorhabdus nematophila ATCC 19061]|uniref:Uncharacterized protein n=1 Tax=Xenorhabdus nematophila (strain ATCC 19061 / DSM 3370 / CCUG 14189 / LMG 1036 / NCIMB 9965 / AN6) TaxID=406817 RepID=D3VC09_XENNA|nr:hypothetical protein XNC1_1599 [Xenorhabdus nematophila ATCC 19061]CEF33532.1 hypothetical protein XNW1_480044 [Xenorhabdus nematophila str. Websteri]